MFNFRADLNSCVGHLQTPLSSFHCLNLVEKGSEIWIILEVNLLFFTLSEWWWSCPGSRPRAGVRSWSLEKQYAFLSSLRALCLSLAIAVCHTTARRGRTLSSLSCIPPSCHSLTHSPLQMGNTSPSTAQMVLKGLHLPRRELFSSSANRCAQPVPSVIHLSICHPVLEPCYMTPSLLPLHPLRTSKWLLIVINMLCGSVLGI